MIRDGRRRVLAAVAVCALAAALAPVAHATLQASVDPGGLVLADAAGRPDDVTLSTNKTGLFVVLADHANALGPVCPLASAKFHGFQCAPASLVRLDAGGGDDRIDASRMSTPLNANLGPGSDVLVSGTGNDTIATIADGVRDVVDCGPGQDVVDGVADPNDDVAADCESAQRSFAASTLRKSVTVAAPATVTLSIGKAIVPMSFVATLTAAPPKHGKHAKARTLAHASVPAGTGPVTLRFKLAKLSSGFLSRRPDIRAQVNVTAVTSDGRRYPLSLHSQAPGSHPQLTTLYDNQFRLVIPARLRHPKKS